MVSAMLPGLLLITILTVCQPVSALGRGKRGDCGKTWRQIDARCYRYYHHNKTFAEAEVFCKLSKSKLAHIEDGTKWYRLSKERRSWKNYWIKSFSNMVYMQEYSPVDYLSDDSPGECVAVKTKDRGTKLLRKNCNKRLKFVCERPALPTKPRARRYGCPTDWIFLSLRFGKVCLRRFNTTKTFSDANAYCRDVHNGKLVTPRTSLKLSFLEELAGESKLWLGMYGRSNTSMTYSDGSHVSACRHVVKSWPHNQISTLGSCSEKRGFLCEKKMRLYKTDEKRHFEPESLDL